MIGILRQIRIADPKTDLFSGASALDAFLTYFALQQGEEVTEFNSILYAIMNTIGTGPALFLKVALCVGILWILRKTNKEKLLVPLSTVLVIVALSNLMVVRLQGIEI